MIILNYFYQKEERRKKVNSIIYSSSSDNVPIISIAVQTYLLTIDLVKNNLNIYLLLGI